MSRTRFVNASVIDGSGDDPFLATVAVDGDRIHAVTPQAAPEPVAEAPSAGDAVVDCTGLTVMPGLTEAHCHISFNDIVTMETVVAIQPEDHSLIALKNAQMLMARGFTSLFSAAAAKPRLDVAVRNAIDSGMFPGPRIRAASQEISPSGNLGDLNTSYLELPRSIAFSVSCDGEEE
ncbi:MAG: amidohydrolase family protein, partial [Hyphomicrobiales bacterium]|nr:amidohydrolase family protein [Hyphomicrobiales bacterium]